MGIISLIVSLFLIAVSLVLAISGDGAFFAGILSGLVIISLIISWCARK